MMNGTLTLNSTAHVGSTFLVTFYDVEISKINKKSIENKKENIKVFDEAKVLLVDDIELNRSLIINLLSYTKLKFFQAENGKEAIKKAKEIKPDLILMDLKMPVLNGLDATKILKDDISLKDIPVIAVTASVRGAQDEDIKKYFDGYISKPLDFQDLLNEMELFLTYSINKHKIKEEDNLNCKLSDFSLELEDLFRNNYDEDIKNIWQKALKGFSFEDTLVFVQKLEIFANNHNQIALLNFTQQFKQSVENFDIAKMQIEMEEISKLLKKVY